LKFVPCKIGTIPDVIWLRYKYKLRVGLRIQYRKHGESTNWHIGYIWKVNPNGFFFVAHDRQGMIDGIAMVERIERGMPTEVNELLGKCEESFKRLKD